MSGSTFFVCGATGTQGGAVARNLLSRGASVHATVRSLTSLSALALQSLGARLWEADWDDAANVIPQAMAGCTAAFLVFFPDFNDPTHELSWAKHILKAAANAGVKHVVYSSGFGVNNPEKFNFWDPESLMGKFILSKQTIERAVREAPGIERYTILRPGNFMSNYLQPAVKMYAGLATDGVWATAFEPTSRMPCVDPSTIGAFAVAAMLDDPAKFAGKEVNFADEVVTIADILDALAKKTGRDIRAEYLGQAEIEAQMGTNPFIMSQFAARNLAEFVDMGEVKAYGVPLTTFDEYLEREKERVKETYRQLS